MKCGADELEEFIDRSHQYVTGWIGFPENTIPAFQSGIDVGAGWIELDLFRTKDGQLVVTHDRTTNRVGDQNLVVAEAVYGELAKVDVATDLRRRTSKTFAECPPHKIPPLKVPATGE